MSIFSSFTLSVPTFWWFYIPEDSSKIDISLIFIYGIIFLTLTILWAVFFVKKTNLQKEGYSLVKESFKIIIILIGLVIICSSFQLFLINRLKGFNYLVSITFILYFLIISSIIVLITYISVAIKKRDMRIAKTGIYVFIFLFIIYLFLYAVLDYVLCPCGF